MTKAKVVLIGDSGVGKTAIVNMQLQSMFDIDTPPTIGSLTHTTTIQVDDQEVELNLWDTAGQERYMSLAKSFTHNTDVALIVADISRPATIDNIDTWAETLDVSENRPTIIVVLNKSDLAVNNSKLIRDAREKLVGRYDRIMIVSALVGSNIPELFRIVANEALKNQSAVRIAGLKDKEGKGGCC